MQFIIGTGAKSLTDEEAKHWYNDYDIETKIQILNSADPIGAYNQITRELIELRVRVLMNFNNLTNHTVKT